MIHKVAATILIVHSRHTGSSTPATKGTNILLLVTRVVVATAIVLVIMVISSSVASAGSDCITVDDVYNSV